MLAAVLTTKLVVGTAWVVVSADAVTDRLNVLAEVWAVGLVLSVAVTVKLVAASSVVGVPLIVPVAVAKLRPVGSVPPDRA